jgi:putative spermidine/putrescine transport system permease protein
MSATAASGRALPFSRAFRRRLGAWALVGPALLLLVPFFFYPLARILMRSLSATGQADLGDFDFSLAHYASALTDPVYRIILRNTFVIALQATVVVVLLAYPAAYLFAHLERRWAATLLLLTLLPFWTSILVRLYAFTQILGRRGIINNMLVESGAVARPVDLLFNQFAAVVGMVHYLLPYMLLVLFSCMVGIDRQLLTAARSLGATGGQSFRRVFLPLSLPGLYAGTLLVFALGLGFFLTPAILGGTGQITIAAYIRQRVALLEWGVASAMGVLLLALTLTLLVLFNRLFRVEGLLSVGASTQKGTAAGHDGPRAGTRRTLWAHAAIVVFFLIFPLGVVVMNSFSPTPFLAFPPRGFSLRWYADIVTDPRWLDAIRLSIVVGVLAAALATLLGLSLAVALVRVAGRGRAVLRTLLLMPIVVPVILTAAGMFDIQSQLGLRGTIPGLVLAHAVLALPLATLVIAGALQGADVEIENAAVTLGATRAQAFRMVTLRAILPAVSAAAILAFITSWDEIVVALFLTSTDRTLPILIFSFLESDVRPTIAAIGTVMMIGLVLLRLLGQAGGRARAARA